MFRPARSCLNTSRETRDSLDRSSTRRGRAKGHHLVLRQELRSQTALPQTAPREKGIGGVDIGTGVAKKVTVRVENVEEQKEQRPQRRKGRFRWTLRQATSRHLQTHRRATCRHRPLLTEPSQRESDIDGDIRTRIRTGPKAARTVSGSTVAEEGEEKGTTPEASCEESCRFPAPPPSAVPPSINPTPQPHPNPSAPSRDDKRSLPGVVLGIT
eukprot:s1310_g2.t1